MPVVLGALVLGPTAEAAREALSLAFSSRLVWFALVLLSTNLPWHCGQWQAGIE